MSFKGTTTNKLNGGLGRSTPTADGVFAMAYAIASEDLPEDTAHNTAYKLLQPEDAEALGFDAAFDANNDMLLFHFVSEFFRLSPEGTLYLIPVPDELDAAEILGQAAFKAVLRAKTDIKGLAIAGTTETLLAVDDIVESVQTHINSLAAEEVDLDFVILQALGEASVQTIANYPDLRVKNAPNVSVSIAQDPYIAGMDAGYAKYADVGAILGMLSIRKVNENLGSVDIELKPAVKRGAENYPLTEGSLWEDAALSDGQKVSALSAADKESLTAKGYIYPGSFQGYGGVYFNGSPTCTSKEDDFAYIENNRVWNKAKRGIRRALLPKVRGRVKKDPQTGYIRSTTITNWENLALKALNAMEIADEISGKDVYINPKQTISEDQPLKIKVKVVTDDIVFEFEIDLGLSKKI